MLRNTRMPGATIFENLEAGASIDDHLAWYDGLDRDQVKLNTCPCANVSRTSKQVCG